MPNRHSSREERLTCTRSSGDKVHYGLEGAVVTKAAVPEVKLVRILMGEEAMGLQNRRDAKL